MAKKMSMKEWEASPQDKAKDKKLAKKGIKEGSPKDNAADKKALAKINSKKAKKKGNK